MVRVQADTVLANLPPVEPFDPARPGIPTAIDAYICALGFEERCLAIPSRLAAEKSLSATKALYLKYETNQEDNEENEGDLRDALQSFSTEVSYIEGDAHDFSAQLAAVLKAIPREGRNLRVAFDISVCSSKFILITTKVLSELPVDLYVLYAEAETYHPTKAEAEGKEWSQLTIGTDDVSASPEHPGPNKDGNPEAVLAFATFNPIRTRVVLAKVDEPLLRDPKRVLWIVGRPHAEKDDWRADHVRKANAINKDSVCYEVSTFDYRETAKLLFRIERLQDERFHEKGERFHLNISPFGSKLQSLGIALFWHVHPEVTIHFVTPQKYDSKRYTEGAAALWVIRLSPFRKTLEELDKIGAFVLLDDAAIARR